MRLAAPALCFALLAFLPHPGRCSSLAEVLADVYESNPRLAAARAHLQATREELPIARSNLRPQLHASTTSGVAQIENDGGNSQLFTTRNVLELRQPVLTGGAGGARVQQATEAIAAERARVAAVEQEVLLATVRAYAEVGLARRRLDLARASEARLTEELEITRQRFRFGDATATDIAQGESRRAGAGAAVATAQEQVAIASDQFQQLVGTMPGALDPLPEFRPLPATLGEALDRAASHPAAAMAERSLQGARAGVDLARSGSRPKLSLSGSVGYIDQPESDLGRRTEASVAAIVSVPLYQGGGEAARLRQARQNLAGQRYNLDEVRRAVERDVHTAWQSRQSARSRIANLEAQVRAAGIARDGVRDEARIGARSIVDIFDAEADYFAAAQALEEVKTAAVLASWGLAAAIGELSADRLSLPVEGDASLPADTASAR